MNRRLPRWRSRAVTAGERPRRRALLGAVATAVVLAGLPLAPSVRAEHGGGEARGVATACPPDQVDSAGFTDVAGEGEGQRAAIDCIAAHGVTKGTSATTYDPGGTVTRAQMASFVMRTLDRVGGYERPADAPNAFADDDADIHHDDINDGAAEDVIRGRADGTYGADGSVTRAQMASFVVRVLEAAGAAVPADAPDAFGDDAGDTHEGAIDALAALHVVVGTAAGTYGPGAAVTRSQMALFLGRSLDLLTTEGLVSPFAGPTVTVTVAITSGPADGTFANDTTPTYAGKASGPGATVGGIEVAADGAGASSSGVTCSGCGTADASWSFTPVSPLAEGAHRIAVTAVDDARHTVASTTVGVTIDTVAPSFEGITATRQTKSAAALFSEPLDCVTVAASDFTATVAGSPAAVSAASCSGAAASAVALTLGTTLAVGNEVTVTLTGAVKDRAGNEAASSITRRVVVPATDQPSLSVTSGPQAGAFTPAARPTWGGAAGGADGLKVASVEARIDSAAFAAVACTGCPSGNVAWSFSPGSNLDDGSRTVEFRAVDEGGVRSVPASRTFTVDTVRPEFTSISTALRNPDVTATFTDADGIDCSTVRVGGTSPSFTAKVAGTASNVSGVSCGAPSSKAVVLTLDRAPLGGDVVEIVVAATGVADRAGNAVDPTNLTRSVTVTNQAPTLQVLSAPASPTNDPSPTYTGSASDPDGVVAGVQAQLDEGAFADVECSGCGTPSATWSYTTPLTDDDHTITFRAVDNGGGRSASVDRSITKWTVVVAVTDQPVADGGYTNAPTLEYGGTAGSGTVASVQVSVDDGDFSPVRSCTGCGSGAATWSHVLELDEGPHVLAFRALDDGGRSSVAVARAIIVDRIKPAFESIGAVALMSTVDAIFDEGVSPIDCKDGDVKASFTVTFDATNVQVLQATCDENVIELQLAGAPPQATNVQVLLSGPVQDLAGNTAVTGNTRKMMV